MHTVWRAQTGRSQRSVAKTMDIPHTLRGLTSALLIFVVAIRAAGNEDISGVLPEFIGMWSGGAAAARSFQGWTVEFVIWGGATRTVGFLTMETDYLRFTDRLRCIHYLALDTPKMKDGAQNPEAAMDRNVLYMNSTSFRGSEKCRYGLFKVELFNDSEMRAELEWLDEDGEIAEVWKTFMTRVDDGTTGKVLETCEAEDSGSLGPRIGTAPAKEKEKKKKDKKGRKEANKKG